MLKLLLYHQQEKINSLENENKQLQKDYDKLERRWEERTRDDHDGESSSNKSSSSKEEEEKEEKKEIHCKKCQVKINTKEQ